MVAVRWTRKKLKREKEEKKKNSLEGLQIELI